MKRALLVVGLFLMTLMSPSPSGAQPATPTRSESAAPTTAHHRARMRLVVRGREGVTTTVTVSGPRTVTARLHAADRRLVLTRRLPRGRYVVTATRATAPLGPDGHGTVFRPRISRHHFRVTPRTRHRIDVTVRMRPLVRPVELRVTAVSAVAVGLAWRLPAETTAVVCSRHEPAARDGGPTHGPVIVPVTRKDCRFGVSSASATRRTVVDRVDYRGSSEIYAYGLFLKATSGRWVRADDLWVTVPDEVRPSFSVEPGRLSRIGAGDQPDLSADARWVTWTREGQVYLRDRSTGRTTLVTATADGTPTEGSATRPSISADGRWIAFIGWADDLAPGGTVDGPSVYLVDRLDGAVQRIGPSVEETAVSLSDDGGRLVYGCSISGPYEVCLWDRATQTITRLTRQPAGSDIGSSILPSISGDGRYVAYSILDFADDDLSVYSYSAHRLDTRTGQRVLVSHDAAGRSAPWQSFAVQVVDDGSVLFDSNANNLSGLDSDGTPDAFVYDGQTGAVSLISDQKTVFGNHGYAWANTDFRYGDLYFDWDVRPAMSADGRYVTYEASESRPVDHGQEVGAAGGFLVDRVTGTKTLVVPGPGPQARDYGYVVPTISPDGRHVAFSSELADLVPGDSDDATDVFVLDRTG